MTSPYAGITSVNEMGYSITIHYDANGTNIHNDNIDIFVDFEDSMQRYGATYFTLENVRTLMERYQQTGEDNYGQYFWCSDMVIVKDLSIQTVRESIAHLLSVNEFETAFRRYDNP